MSEKQIQDLDRVTIRFAGDSGDGMQLTGGQFTDTSAMAGNDLITIPDYPSEIRAPAGKLYGVSGFQVQLSSHQVFTPGDQPDVLVAMNPAALKVNLNTLRDNAIIIVNTDAFSQKNLDLAKYEKNPLEDDSLKGFQVFPVAITTLTRNALEDSSLSVKDKDRCKNFFALGITYWMFSRPLDYTKNWIKTKFKNKQELIDANIAALEAGYAFASATQIFTTAYRLEKAKKKPGIYRKITGNEGIALAFIAAAMKAGKELFQGSYPITPASEILHELSKYRNYGVKTFQAEDEIAGITSAIGAAYAGDLAITTTSGPGLALKTEAIGLAVIAELPLVIVNVQRGGPSTGLPTKMEQSDLLQAVYGRNGEAPVPVVAAKSPADCFRTAYEAVQIAFKFNTPVLLLSDGYIAQGAEPWLIPNPEELPEIKVEYATDPETYLPYARDPETLARKMVIPGMPGFESHIGGLEKDITGNVSQDPDNHDKMVRERAAKVQRIDDYVEEPELVGAEDGDVLIVSWGSTFGVVHMAMDEIVKKGWKVSWLHLHWINPLPKVLGKYIHNFKRVVVPEVNLGQLVKILRSEYLVDAQSYSKVKGMPLKSTEIIEAVEIQLKGLEQ